MLGIVACLCAFLTLAYVSSHSIPGPMTETQANALLDTLKDAVTRRDANAILATISPDPETRVAGMSPEKLRNVLFQAFHSLDSGETLTAQTKNVKFQGGEDSATMDYDLSLPHAMQQMVGEHVYHVTMQLRPVDAPHFLGLYHTREWRITGAQTDATELNSFME